MTKIVKSTIFMVVEGGRSPGLPGPVRTTVPSRTTVFNNHDENRQKSAFAKKPDPPLIGQPHFDSEAIGPDPATILPDMKGGLRDSNSLTLSLNLIFQKRYFNKSMKMV